MAATIDKDAILAMLKYFAHRHVVDADSEERLKVSNQVKGLLERDYQVGVVNNERGALCEHYPCQIFILESLKDDENRVNSAEELQSLFEGDSHPPHACRRWQNICRSATLARSGEIYCRQGYTAVTSTIYGSLQYGRAKVAPGSASNTHVADSMYLASANNHQPPAADESSVTKCRQADVDLLNHLGVKLICDLMIEHRKSKFGVYVSSSEKADTKDRYHGFNLLVAPYPGVEWFNSLRDQEYNPCRIHFDWNGPEVNAVPTVPTTCPHLVLDGIDWSSYATWDLVTMTQTYLRTILAHVRVKHSSGDEGVLVHCISGWDRTPLFVSLLRLSLWADGVVHASLSPEEILYLTVGYDWFLFGHMLPSRLNKGEEIFLFCFDFLQYIDGDEFVFNATSSPPSSTDEASPDHTPADSRGEWDEPVARTPVGDTLGSPILAHLVPGHAGYPGTPMVAQPEGSSQMETGPLRTASHASLDSLTSCDGGNMDGASGLRPSGGSTSSLVEGPASKPIAVPRPIRSNARGGSTTPSGAPPGTEGSQPGSLDSWQFVEKDVAGASPNGAVPHQELSDPVVGAMAQALSESPMIMRLHGPPRPRDPGVARPPPLLLHEGTLSGNVQLGSTTQHRQPPPATQRAMKLHAVRELFIPLYRDAVPSAGRGDGWMQWLSSVVATAWTRASGSTTAQ